MIRMLVSREVSRLRTLCYTFFLVLPILMLLLIEMLQLLYGFSDDSDTLVKFWFIAVVVPLLFIMLLACQLVAGDKENGRLQALLELPIAPVAVWAVKFCLGWFLSFTYIIYATFFCFAATGSGEFFGYPLLFFALTAGFAYTLSFLISCYAQNALTSLLVLVVIAVSGFAVYTGMTEFSGSMLANVTGLWFLDDVRTDQMPVWLAGSLDFITLPLAFFSLYYFLTRHRRLEVRLLPYVILFGPLFGLLFIPLAYLGVLAVHNHPALDHAVPRISTAWLHDAGKRESHRQFVQLLDDWHQQFGEQADDDAAVLTDTAALINCIHNGYFNDTVNSSGSDTEIRVLRLTQDARDTITEFMATHSLAMYIDAPPHDTPLPRVIGLLALFRLESLALQQEIRQGNRAAALRRFTRNVHSIRNLYRDNLLFMVLVADACYGIMVEDLPVLFPFDRAGGTAAEADALLAQLAEVETEARPALARSLEGEAAYFYYFMTVVGTSVHEGYPLLNRRRSVQLYEDAMLPLITVSRQPFHLNRSYEHVEPVFAWHDHLLSPLSPVFTAIAFPKLTSSRDKHAMTIEYGRLGQVHVRLWKYVRAQGRFPATLDELWQFAGVPPLTSELTGQPYPYTLPQRTARVEFVWARNVGGGTLRQQ